MSSITSTIAKLKESIHTHMNPYNLGDEGETTKLIYKLIKHVEKAQPGAGWVKASERLPGWKLKVKWRDGNDHSYATDGEISFFEMDKPNLEGWEWLDESQAPTDPISSIGFQPFDPELLRAMEAVEFAEWIREQNYKPYAGSWYLNGNNYAHQPHSTNNLYQLFKEQKDK